MNKGRAKCDRLKKIRKAVADKLNVDLHQSECTFEGNCRGTCPKCKQEEEILNRELLKRAAGAGIGVKSGGVRTAGFRFYEWDNRCAAI